MTPPRLSPAKLRAARESRGLSQSALARAVGVAHARICDLESNKIIDPKISTVAKIAKLLRCKVDSLLE